MFDYFVVLAEMRTGSNFLEANLNALPGVSCHGEAFNPHFIGYPKKADLLGVSQAQRDADPLRLIAAMKTAPGLAGCRYFHDHDPRVLDKMLDDPRCAKIVLTRNPLDSYVSWKIARTTNQWKLTNVKKRKEARAVFEGAEFARYVTELQAFQIRLLNRLQTSGQTAFYIGYDDLQEIGVINGLASWLGVAARLDSLDKSLKVQNPKPVAEKVVNPEKMAEALGAMDMFNLSRTPNFEPRRGAAVPSYVGGARTGLLFMPIPGGPTERVRRWMAALDAVEEDALVAKMTQKQLRHWKRQMVPHRSFTVLSHPAARAHDVFCARILSAGPGSYLKIRETLRRNFGLALPDGSPDDSYTRSAHRATFEAYLGFVKANLAGQTAIRVDAAWSSQSQVLNSFADFALPDHVVRDHELREMLPDLARLVGHPDPPAPATAEAEQPYTLGDIHDAALEEMIADVYQRDYVMFGFEWWRPGTG